MTWVAVQTISSVIYTASFLVSVFVLWAQLSGLKRAVYAQSFSSALDRLQNEEVRKARRVVFTLLSAKPLPWTEDETRAAEVVCHTYDVVGIMVRNALLPKELIVDSWGDSLRRLWPIVEPLVSQYRRERDSPEFWDDFEWLYCEAVQLEKRRKT